MSNLYTEKDIADVVDADGNVVGQAPKAWADKGLLADGLKIKSGRASKPKDETPDGPPEA